MTQLLLALPARKSSGLSFSSLTLILVCVACQPTRSVPLDRPLSALRYHAPLLSTAIFVLAFMVGRFTLIPPSSICFLSRETRATACRLQSLLWITGPSIFAAKSF
ncbi:hypothetical protein BO70DRAFT_10928 [Aspergillus heteromorphus CBS 117.55]|uniref:Uncharacterized protein n=1 Tax=Aspergillus heteromorphus CBS 117.55 TaxID=1448321 RepID=A0A317X1D4_9EURO|nr:uncharacterized protein BO70DRAFT_10928 [Aspergillus heteromorphus CBS 117.55]PWY92454.1 hypothetical protein BO70DRAFT_10928 [Aspergillus heteromorphus CBS 117.55]